jgi:hypothetical protein
MIFTHYEYFIITKISLLTALVKVHHLKLEAVHFKERPCFTFAPCIFVAGYFPAQQILVLHLQFTAFISKEINMKNLHHNITKCSFKHHW